MKEAVSLWAKLLFDVSYLNRENAVSFQLEGYFTGVYPIKMIGWILDRVKITTLLLRW